MKDKLVATIHGETFVVFPSVMYSPITPRLEQYGTLDDAYKCPSDEKRRAYNYWVDWFKSMGSPKYGIYSANCHKFSMCGLITIEGEEYYVYISKSRRLLIPLEH